MYDNGILMAGPPNPLTIETLDSRLFSFYPALVGVECNEWEFLRSTWSEVLVRNHRSGVEIWVSKAYIGDVSRTEDPVVIVGLNRELEYRGGMLRPFQQRVLKMPGAGTAAMEPASGESAAPEPGRRFRLEASDRSAVRLIGIALGCAILLYVLVVAGSRLTDIRQSRAVFVTGDRGFQELTARDDRFAITSKLGNPTLDRFKEVGTIQFEALSYPDRSYTVLLMGTDQQSLLYIGTVDDQWKPLHSVGLRNGGTTDNLLRSIQRF